MKPFSRMSRNTELLAQEIVKSEYLIAFTGAGISTESGIPDYRSKGGIWDMFRPVYIDEFMSSRESRITYWQRKAELYSALLNAQPNAAHKGLAELYELGFLKTVVTQNIDGLHKKAGNRNVTEIHGSLREIYCLSCGREYLAPDVPSGNPPYCECGGVLKPNTVLFGEQLPPEALEKAQHESSTCSTMLVIGTSAVVQPAASLPFLAKQTGAVVIEVNPEKSFPVADYYIPEKAGVALGRIVQEVKKLKNSAT